MLGAGTMGRKAVSVVVSSGLRRVRVMCGKPSIRMDKQVNETSLLKWGIQSRNYYRITLGVWLEIEALIYWLDHYLIDPLEHPKENEKAVAILRKLPSDPPVGT